MDKEGNVSVDEKVKEQVGVVFNKETNTITLKKKEKLKEKQENQES